MNDLLPPRLPDPGATPASGDVPALLARARARRRRRAETALCVPLVMGLALGGLQAVGGGNGRSELRTVEPAAERDVHDVVRDIAEAVGLPEPDLGGGDGGAGVGPGTGGAAGPGRAAGPGAGAKRGHDPESEPSRDPDRHGGPPELRYTTIDREIVADRSLEPCVYETSQDDRFVWCTRYIGPAEARSGQPVDLVVEYCPHSGDGSMEFAYAQEITVLLYNDELPWFAVERPRKDPHRLDLPMGSCARWTIHWDGLSVYEPTPLKPGEYSILMATGRLVNGEQPRSVFAGVGDRKLLIT